VPVFSRKKPAEPIVVAVVPDKPAAGKTTPKKGKPTPRRNEAQAARRQPIVQSTVTKAPQSKEERALLREKQKQARDESYEGMKRGDEKHLSARDRGPQRRYVRDFVDGRRNFGEYFMPASLAFIVLYFMALQLGQELLALIAIGVLYIVVIVALVDTLIMWRRLKGQVIGKFGNVEPGTMMYASMRAMQNRRLRIPNAPPRWAVTAQSPPRGRIAGQARNDSN